MKELSIEEKARRYDEAIEIAKEINNEQRAQPFNVMTRVFPELAESENERIRQKLIDYCDCSHVTDTFNGIPWENVRAWLEKQGEHANFRNKIQIGDKVTRNEDGVLVNLSQLKRVAKKDEKQGEQESEDKVEPKFKVGDVIKPKDGGHEPWKIMQVDILDKKYRFKDGYVIHFSQEDAYELVEHKPAFEMKTQEESLGIDSDTYSKIVDECVYGEQKPAGWSEEDEIWIDRACMLLDELNHLSTLTLAKIPSNVNDIISHLKSLKDRVQPKQEWSEEDKETIDYLIDYLESELDSSYTKEDKEEFTKEIELLKSIRPQNRWKPTKRQLLELSCVISGCSFDTPVLVELEEDLKKLMEK